MLILTIRTDKPDAELRLFDDQNQLAEIVWQAHRQLAETLHLKIKDLLARQQKTLADLEGIVAYQGPGSFTGLRIGLSVANALADALQLPIVAGISEDWQVVGIAKLLAGDQDGLVMPEYGAPVRITEQKK